MWLSSVYLVFGCTVMCQALKLDPSILGFHPQMPWLDTSTSSVQPSSTSVQSSSTSSVQPSSTSVQPSSTSVQPSSTSSPESSPPPPVYKKPEIFSLHIYSDIKYRFATTLITSRVKNPSESSQEAVFDVTLPNEAFITNLTIEMDGKIVVGEIKEKEKAKRQYQAAQARGESAGYIGTKHRETNKFNLAITVAAMSKVSFNLTYQELLKRKSGHYEQVIYYIDPGQPVSDMDITVSILESRNITKLAVPPLRNDVGADLIDLDSLAVISQPTPKTAYVKYVPNVAQQMEQSTNGIAGQFVVQYDVERNMDAGDILVVNGYFVHFFAPEGLRPMPNDVLFILDTSGSMRGTKMSQLKQSMQSILREMNEGDRFNIMTFSGSTSLWKTQMVEVADEDIMEEAKEHINSIYAGGSTNINGALIKGIQFLADASDTGSTARSPIIIFLTDGKANSGVTRQQQIINNVQSVNEGGIPIFSLAFGKGADYDTVKKIALQNNGFGRKIYEASDAALQIAGLYNDVSITLLNNITFKYLDAPVAKVTKNRYKNYFNGSEIIICGILESGTLHEANSPASSLDVPLSLEVSSNSYGGPNVLVLSEPLDLDLKDDTQNLTKLGDYETITEKVWAYLTIKQLLDKELVSSNQTQKDAYKRKILELSMKYGFVTPLTSMVVTKSDEEEEERFVIDDDKPVKPKAPVPVHQSSGVAPSNPGWQQKMNGYVNYGSSAGRSGPGQLLSQLPPLSNWRSSGPAGLYDPRPRRPVVPPRRKSQPTMRNDSVQKRRKTKGYQAPLQVQFPQVELPVCFNMFSKAIASEEKTFILYRNETRNVTITVTLKNDSKKRLKQSGITSLSIKDVDTVHTITSNRTDWSSYPLVHSRWSVNPVVNGTETVALRLALGDVEMYIRPIRDGLLSLMVNTFTATAADEGILGEILSIQLKLQRTKIIPTKRGKKPPREVAFLTINKRRRVVVKSTKRPFHDAVLANGKDACWEPRKGESKFYDINQYIKV